MNEKMGEEQLQLFDTGPGDPPRIIEDRLARDRERSRLYALRNPDKIKAKYVARRDHYLAYGRQWRAQNPGFNREWKKRDRLKNPEKWLERDYRLKTRREMRKRGAFVEDVDRLVVFERDGWICGVCGEEVDRSCKAPHPRSPSLDHIVPIAHGGEHSYANVQLAHFWCNSAKSDSLPLEEAS